jgi:hypothetical protein
MSMLPYQLRERGNRLDAGEYDDTPDIGYAIHFAVADGGARGWFDLPRSITSLCGAG